MRRFLFVILLAALALAACGAGDTVPGPLDGTRWRLVSFDDPENQQPVPEEVLISADFDSGRISGTTTCASYIAEYLTEGSQIEIGEITSTSIACPDEASSIAIQRSYFVVLRSADTFEVVGEELLITYEEGTKLLTYELNAVNPAGVSQ